MNRCKECGTLYYSTLYEAMYGSDEPRDPDWVCPECRERCMEQKSAEPKKDIETDCEKAKTMKTSGYTKNEVMTFAGLYMARDRLREAKYEISRVSAALPKEDWAIAKEMAYEIRDRLTKIEDLIVRCEACILDGREPPKEGKE